MRLGYLDPGAGSLIAQLAAAGTAGMVVAVKLGWARATRRSRPPEEEGGGQEPRGHRREPTE